MFRYDFRYSIAVVWEKINVKNNAFNHILYNDYDMYYISYLCLKYCSSHIFLIKHAGNLLNRNTLFKSAKSFLPYCQYLNLFVDANVEKCVDN